jgi:hypothetical protein
MSNSNMVSWRPWGCKQKLREQPSFGGQLPVSLRLIQPFLKYKVDFFLVQYNIGLLNSLLSNINWSLNLKFQIKFNNPILYWTKKKSTLYLRNGCIRRSDTGSCPPKDGCSRSFCLQPQGLQDTILELDIEVLLSLTPQARKTLTATQIKI